MAQELVKDAVEVAEENLKVVEKAAEITKIIDEKIVLPKPVKIAIGCVLIGGTAFGIYRFVKAKKSKNAEEQRPDGTVEESSFEEVNEDDENTPEEE